MDHTGLWDTELTWYSPSVTHWICWGREGDEAHWTMRCWAYLILSKCYSLDLLRSWRWWSTLDYEMLNPPDTLQVLLIGFAKVVKVMKHTGLWDAEPTWYSSNVTHQVCLWKQSLGIHSFRPTWLCLIIEVLETWPNFLQPFGYCILINCTFIFHTTNMFWVHLQHYELFWTC